MLAGLLLAAPTARDGQSQTKHETLLTDTPEYCMHLRDRLDTMLREEPAAPRRVKSLSTESQRLCEEGNVRAGIHRARRALAIMTEKERTR